MCALSLDYLRLEFGLFCFVCPNSSYLKCNADIIYFFLIFIFFRSRNKYFNDDTFTF